MKNNSIFVHVQLLIGFLCFRPTDTSKSVYTKGLFKIPHGAHLLLKADHVRAPLVSKLRVLIKLSQPSPLTLLANLC